MEKSNAVKMALIVGGSQGMDEALSNSLRSTAGGSSRPAGMSVRTRRTSCTITSISAMSPAPTRSRIGCRARSSI